MENCHLCQTELGEEALTQLSCSHRFHTSCVFNTLQMSGPYGYLYQRCCVCDANIFQGVIQPHESLQQEETRINTLYETNRHFRRDVKLYAHALTSSNRAKKEFQDIVKEKKHELAEPYAAIKEQIEQLYTSKKNEILNSNPYKTYKSAHARVMKYKSSLYKKYNLSYESYRILSQKPGLKRIGSSRFSFFYSRLVPSRIIRSGLRLNLKF